MLTARWTRRRLEFKFEARTSRSTMLHKDTYIVAVSDDSRPGVTGIGECALFAGLSREDHPGYESRLDRACRNPVARTGMSSIDFGLETAIADLRGGGRHILHESAWTRGEEGIPINGLIWMGDRDTMAERIDRKMAEGFRVLKLKIGGIDFNQETELLRYIRSCFGADRLELRLDANGSFTPDNAMDRLERLARFGIHSIEQPVKAGQWDVTARLCRESPIDIALDEELIGTRDDADKCRLLDAIAPRYIILKPSLCGGFAESDRWIALAEERGTGWWATSALESNVGLNAIAQWLAAKGYSRPQGLGTGNLYQNNIASPLELRGDRLYYNTSKQWSDLKDILRD